MWKDIFLQPFGWFYVFLHENIWMFVSRLGVLSPWRRTLVLLWGISDKAWEAWRHTIRCRQTILMLQNVKMMPAETFTSNSDDFETTRYMGPQWQEVAQKPVKLGHLIPGLICLMPIVIWVTPRTVDALWMAGHAQLEFIMTECSKTQIRLTGLISHLVL